MRSRPITTLLIILLCIALATTFLQSDLSRPLKKFITFIVTLGKNEQPKLAIDPDKRYYFVDPKNGDDENAGSEARPWKTLYKATAVRREKHGTTVVLRKGVYAERLVPQNNGRMNAWLTFMAYPGEKVTLNGKGDPGPAVDLSGKSYIKVEGLTIANFAGDGVFLGAKSGQHHLVVSHCNIHDIAGSGVRIRFALDVRVTGNRIRNTGKYGIADKGQSANVLLSRNDVSFPGIDCIYIESPNYRIENNYLHDNSRPTDPGEHADGIQVFIDPRKQKTHILAAGSLSEGNSNKSGSSDSDKKISLADIVICRNTIKLNVGSDNETIQSNSMMLENAGGLQVYNNVVIGQGTSNVIDIKNCPDSDIFNNTLVGSKHQGIYIHKDSTGCNVYNNLVYGAKGQSLLVKDDSVDDFSSDHNIYSSPVKWGRSIMSLGQFVDEVGHDKHSVFVGVGADAAINGDNGSNSYSGINNDEKSGKINSANSSVNTDLGFVDFSDFNLRIKKLSPAYNGGYLNKDGRLRYPSTDKDGRRRCVDGVIDIGAYEYTPNQ